MVFAEREVMALQRLLTSLDTSVLDLKESIDGMKPAYNQALQVIANTNVGQEGSKNNLVRLSYQRVVHGTRLYEYEQHCNSDLTIP